jgi:DNA-binding CsgD family transcriptional regulator
MTGPGNGWPLVGRSGEIEYARNALLQATGGGLFLVGPAGVGKTLIARRVTEDLAGDFEFVYLRGSAAISATPYGVLSMVLAQLDEETAANPLMLLSSLQSRFDRGAAGARTLMVLDNVEDFDDLSAMVIAHLVRVGAVRILGICGDLQRVPVELFDLWKDDVVRRLDVEPLDLEKTTELLAAALGNPVSRSAALGLWQASGGNPRYLQAIALADMDSGALALREGVWVSGDGAGSRAGKPVTECVTGQLERITPDQRPLLEAVAVAGGVPLKLLLKVFPPEPVNSLQEQGILEAEQGGPPVLRLSSEALAEVLRAQLVSAPGRAALLALNGMRADSSLPGPSRTALIRWCLDNGVEVKSPELINAARHANGRFDAPAALGFLAAVPDDERGPEAVLETARALGIDRQIDAALAAVATILDGAGPAAGLRLEVELRLTQAGLAMRSHDHAGEAASLLDTTRARLSAAPAGEVHDLLEQIEEFAAEREFFEGRSAGLVESLPMQIQARLARGRPTHRLQGWLASAQAMAGRQEAAVETARSLITRLVGAERDPLEIERAGTHLFTALLAAGYWNEALAMVEVPEQDAGASIYDGSASEFTEGLLHAFAGRSQDALDRLAPAISQLRASDRHGLLPLAEAAAAYVLALRGDSGAAREHLAAVDLETERHPWHYRDSVEYFRILAQGALGEPGAAREKLISRAEANAAAGNKGQELLFLSQAVQLGQDDLVERLCACAATSEGPLSRVLELLGKGIAARNSELLLDAASAALYSGDDGLAAHAAERAIEFLDDGDAMVGVYADQILRRAAAPGRRARNRTILSERERKIARFVARGASNRVIAEAEHVSVRTVEGHVHQILTKLGLSSRKQLALIFK